MLTKKQTVVKIHSEQHTDTHTYFQYEGDDDDYRVGYYLPMQDWVEMNCPEELTVEVVPGDQMNNELGLRDAGERDSASVEWDIDTNRPMSETRRLEKLGA